jgi:hypothetical protein
MYACGAMLRHQRVAMRELFDIGYITAPQTGSPGAPMIRRAWRCEATCSSHRGGLRVGSLDQDLRRLRLPELVTIR